jgi:hypothetical protein
MVESRDTPESLRPNSPPPSPPPPLPPVVSCQLSSHERISIPQHLVQSHSLFTYIYTVNLLPLPNNIATMEKEHYNVDQTPDYNGHAHAQYVDPVTGIENKSGRITEAADLYGNIETAEEYGYVTRGYVQ